MDQIIIYGAGSMGTSYYNFLKFKKIDSIVVGFCDKKASEIKEKFGKPVFTFEEAKKKNLPFLIAIGNKFFDEVESFFLQNGITSYYEDIHAFQEKYYQIDRTLSNREYCAYCHIDNMDRYFDIADSEEHLRFFWGDTICHKLFSCMNPQNIIELACGRGRHVPQYISQANDVTLVDVLEKNINICKERFKNNNNIKYYKNNGYDLSELPDASYTALFTYDAMVHFELLDIAKYLQETHRVLKGGGMALFHHSNNHADYKASFTNAPHGRSFMSKDVFAYLAYRAGLKIVEQKIVDWGGVSNLDCLTLVKK